MKSGQFSDSKAIISLQSINLLVFYGDDVFCRV